MKYQCDYSVNILLTELWFYESLRFGIDVSSVKKGIERMKNKKATDRNVFVKAYKRKSNKACSNMDVIVSSQKIFISGFFTR